MEAKVVTFCEILVKTYVTLLLGCHMDDMQTLHAQQKSHPRNRKQLERGNVACRLWDGMLAAEHRSLSPYVNTILRNGFIIDGEFWFTKKVPKGDRGRRICQTQLAVLWDDGLP